MFQNLRYSHRQSTCATPYSALESDLRAEEGLRAGCDIFLARWGEGIALVGDPPYVTGIITAKILSKNQLSCVVFIEWGI